MDTEFISGLMTDTMWLTVKIALPILLVALIVGLIISILQATTSIQEQTLTFVPKILAIVLAILIFGSWIAGTMMEFTSEIFDMIPDMGRFGG